MICLFLERIFEKRKGLILTFLNLSAVSSSFGLLFITAIVSDKENLVKISAFLAITSPLLAVTSLKLRDYLLTEKVPQELQNSILSISILTTPISFFAVLLFIQHSLEVKTSLILALGGWRITEYLRDLTSIYFFIKDKVAKAILCTFASHISLGAYIICLFFGSTMEFACILALCISLLITLTFLTPEIPNIFINFGPKKILGDLKILLKFSFILCFVNSSYLWILNSPRIYATKFTDSSDAAPITFAYLFLIPISIVVCSVVLGKLHSDKRDNLNHLSKYTLTLTATILSLHYLTSHLHSSQHTAFTSLLWITAYSPFILISIIGIQLTFKKYIREQVVILGFSVLLVCLVHQNLDLSSKSLASAHLIINLIILIVYNFAYNNRSKKCKQ